VIVRAVKQYIIIHAKRRFRSTCCV